jgi:hypothetical protein
MKALPKFEPAESSMQCKGLAAADSDPGGSTQRTRLPTIILNATNA